MRVFTKGEERLSTQHLKAVPTSQWQYVDVEFTATNTDTIVQHGLKPLTVEGINYQVVKASAPMMVFNDQSPTRKPWGDKFILVQSDAVGTARLLLTTEQEA